jgi:hypothetical protein
MFSIFLFIIKYMPQENISYTCSTETDDGLCHTELTKRKHGQFMGNPREDKIDTAIG